MNYKNIFFLAAVVIYLYFFFAAPFEPYHITGEADYPRYTFFSYLLLPDVYFSSWLGINGELGLFDRLPVLLFAFFILISALGFGQFFVRQLFLNKLEPLEHCCFSLILGLGSFSVLSSYFFYGIFLLLPCGVILFFYELSKKQCTLIEVYHSPLFIIHCSLFIPLLFLAAAIPSTDYDVLSYHIAGANEFAEQGRITFLPHNVYADMPFGAEMFYIWGMTLSGNPFTGALTGKVIIALTTLITALGLYCFCKRFCDEPHNETAGIAAMILYLTTPWVFYVSTAGLIDSVAGMYSFFAVYAFILSRAGSKQPRRPLIIGVFLAGFFAGCAAACKYPAVIYAVFPLFVFIIVNNAEQVRRLNKTGFVFLFAVFLACGGWYIKNWYFTGNPVYPLCWNFFGDSTGTWNAAVNSRWTAAHSPHEFGIGQFLSDMYRLFLSSAWNSPLIIPLFLFAFVPLKERGASSRAALRSPLLWLLFFTAVWWFCTHRLERFFVPAIPFLTVFAGFGAANFAERFGKKALHILLIISTVYCFIVCGIPAPGKLNRFLAPLETLRQDPNCSTPWAVYFNQNKPDGKILLVGEAKAFLYEIPVLYSVCWNETPLKAFVESGTPADEFRKQNIRYILVDWSEINRFRSKGNYGFSEFVQQSVFDKLIADGILEKMEPPNKDCAETNTVVYRVIR
ncbi:hypothetical protein FACS1894214_3230 [Planctomycetales bacterium]|nr:hypothetical protein FACS1894214_3230 [Planctomycetales bacterium]